MKIFLRFLAFTLTLLLPPAIAHADDLKGKPRIVDGSEYRCGEMATFALAEIIETHWITCKGETTDRYKRRIAVCYAGPYDINAEMVRRGWALAYRRYSKDYVDEEDDASSRKAGIWQGEFMKPWEWRRR